MENECARANQGRLIFCPQAYKHDKTSLLYNEPAICFPEYTSEKSTFIDLFLSPTRILRHKTYSFYSGCHPRLINIGSQTQKTSMLSFSIPIYQQVKYNSCASFRPFLPWFRFIMILDLIKKKKVFYIYSAALFSVLQNRSNFMLAQVFYCYFLWSIYYFEEI